MFITHIIQYKQHNISPLVPKWPMTHQSWSSIRWLCGPFPTQTFDHIRPDSTSEYSTLCPHIPLSEPHFQTTEPCIPILNFTGTVICTSTSWFNQMLCYMCHPLHALMPPSLKEYTQLLLTSIQYLLSHQKIRYTMIIFLGFTQLNQYGENISNHKLGERFPYLRYLISKLLDEILSLSFRITSTRLPWSYDTRHSAPGLTAS